MKMTFDTASLSDYANFLRLKSCPTYRWSGNEAIIPDEYAAHFGREIATPEVDYSPPSFAFDYQRDIARISIRKRKFCVFARCGLGKTLILLEFAHHAMRATNRKVLIVAPLMVVRQTASESKRFYGDDFPLRQIPAAALGEWMQSPGAEIGITNYEAIRDGLRIGTVAGLILDESSMMKSAYGKWGTRLIELGAGLEWKLCLTGTPAPNDRIEYGNHAVFMDQARSVNEFLATYFVNRGQTDSRWELRPHALRPFYRALSHWCVFLTNPSTYGWRDNCDTIPPIEMHIDHIPMTPEQVAAFQNETGQLVVSGLGGITTRAILSGIAKGNYRGRSIPSLKPKFISDLVESFGDESRIVWCRFNAEQDTMDKCLGVPEGRAVSIRGETPFDDRMARLDAFQSGKVKTMISKPKVLGFGLNLQVATRQVFSGITDSYEETHQAIMRSNRVGSTKALHVHIPVTDLEEPMLRNVLAKSDRVDADIREQEVMFRGQTWLF